MSQRTGYFVDAALGANIGDVSDFTFSNPTGALATTSAVSGDKIIMDNTDELDIVAGGKAGLGYRFGNNVLLGLAYSYVDEMEFEGFATFGGSPFQQLMTAQAHTFMVELGYNYPITGRYFVEGGVSGGIALVSTDGVQGGNQGNYNPFPGNTRTNLAAGAELGVGYQLTNKVALTLTGDYTYLGRASTGRSGTREVATSGGNMNLSEELSADLSVWRAMIGIRYSF